MIDETSESRLTRAEILDHATRISDTYADQGMDLTLRQLYYRFVATGLTGSGQAIYKRIGDVLAEARLTGQFPLDRIVDRGRHVSLGDFTRRDLDAERAREEAGPLVRSLPGLLLDVDRWQGQETFVSVWVEKEALAGVFEPICQQLGVSFFACKGYPSVSALWEWVKLANRACGSSRDQRMRWPGDAVTTEHHEGAARKCVVLYFGDHDPDGWEIPRSAERSIRTLTALKGLPLDIEFDRVALNMDQIRRYRPPPFEAKVTSARYEGYVREHGTQDAWELDALDPVVLRDLIQREVSGHFDRSIEEQNNLDLDAAREELREAMTSAEFIRTIRGA